MFRLLRFFQVLLLLFFYYSYNIIPVLFIVGKILSFQRGYKIFNSSFLSLWGLKNRILLRCETSKLCTPDNP